MWKAICYSLPAEYKQKFSSLELCQQLPLRFLRFPGDISTPSHIKVNQGSQIKNIFKNEKRLIGKRLDLFVLSGLCLPLGVHSPGKEASAFHKGRATHLCPPPRVLKRHDHTGKMVVISHGNCSRVEERLIIRSCAQEQLC